MWLMEFAQEETLSFRFIMIYIVSHSSINQCVVNDKCYDNTIMRYLFILFIYMIRKHNYMYTVS